MWRGDKRLERKMKRGGKTTGRDRIREGTGRRRQEGQHETEKKQLKLSIHRKKIKNPSIISPSSKP